MSEVPLFNLLELPRLTPKHSPIGGRHIPLAQPHVIPASRPADRRLGVEARLARRERRLAGGGRGEGRCGADCGKAGGDGCRGVELVLIDLVGGQTE